MNTPTYTHEATTEIHFPSDQQFVEFRAEVEDRYDGRMVRVQRGAVYTSGRELSPKGCVLAEVHHSRGLGAELKGLSHSHFGGNTVRTVYAAPPTLNPPPEV